MIIITVPNSSTHLSLCLPLLSSWHIITDVIFIMLIHLCHTYLVMHYPAWIMPVGTTVFIFYVMDTAATLFAVYLSSKFAENNLWILSQGCVCCHFILYVCCVRGYCHMHGYCCRFILYPLYCRYYHMRGYYHRFILHDVYCRRCCIHGYCLHFILYAMCRGYCHQFVFYVC